MAKKRKTPSQEPKPKGAGLLAIREALLTDLLQLIQDARAGVAIAVNSALVLLSWQVGHRIRTEVLRSKRATYGNEILATLSKELIAEKDVNLINQRRTASFHSRSSKWSISRAPWRTRIMPTPSSVG
jgi:hypothetical protein